MQRTPMTAASSTNRSSHATARDHRGVGTGAPSGGARVAGATATPPPSPQDLPRPQEDDDDDREEESDPELLGGKHVFLRLRRIDQRAAPQAATVPASSSRTSASVRPERFRTWNEWSAPSI